MSGTYCQLGDRCPYQYWFIEPVEVMAEQVEYLRAVESAARVMDKETIAFLIENGPYTHGFGHWRWKEEG